MITPMHFNRARALTLAIMIGGIPSQILLADCPAEWLTGSGRPGLAGTNIPSINATIRWDPDGDGPEPESLVVGGWFTSIDGVAANSIAIWNGTRWRPLGSGMGINVPYVYALAVFEGDLIAGGSFSTAGGVAANRVARWNGTTWQPLSNGLVAASNQHVYALAIYNGQLIAGGNFSNSTGGPGGIARWNGTTWQQFSGAFFGSAVRALTVHDSELLAAGSFSTIGGISARSIARWNGTNWRPLGTGIFGGGVSSLTSSNGDLVAGGNFTTAGDLAASCVARWNGSTWQPIGTGLGPTTRSVFALAAYDGNLIAAGSFDAAGTEPMSGIARWNGTSWQKLHDDFAGYGDFPKVYALAEFRGELIAGGHFFTADDIETNGIARWTGDRWRAFATGFGGVPYPTIYALRQYNGEVIAGGNFTTAGGLHTNNIARWNGSEWRALGTGLTSAGDPPEVYALAEYNGELIVGGFFTGAGGVGVGRIARWNGTNWAALGAGVDAQADPPFVAALAVYNGEMIAAGRFTSAGGTPVSNIARWNGSNWRPVGAGIDITSQYGAVYSLFVHRGELIAGGWFGTFANRDAIMRWNGTGWRSLGGGITSNTYAYFVSAMGEYGGELFAGGYFSTAAGSPAKNIARWNGTSWRPVGSGTNFESYAMTNYDGHLIVGGYFSEAGGQPASAIARWNGTGWLPLGTGVGLADESPGIRALTNFGGELVAAGFFSAVGDEPASSWARWSPLIQPPLVTQQPRQRTFLNGASTTFSIAASGGEPLEYRWRKDGIPLTDDGRVSGSATNTLTISNASSIDVAGYDCLVTNVCGEAVSNRVILLIVHGIAAPLDANELIAPDPLE